MPRAPDPGRLTCWSQEKTGPSQQERLHLLLRSVSFLSTTGARGTMHPNWSTDQASVIPAQKDPSSNFTSTREPFKIFLIIPVLVPVVPNNSFTRSPTLKPRDRRRLAFLNQWPHGNHVFYDLKIEQINFSSPSRSFRSETIETL